MRQVEAEWRRPAPGSPLMRESDWESVDEEPEMQSTNYGPQRMSSRSSLHSRHLEQDEQSMEGFRSLPRDAIVSDVGGRVYSRRHRTPEDEQDEYIARHHSISPGLPVPEQGWQRDWDLPQSSHSNSQFSSQRSLEMLADAGGSSLVHPPDHTSDDTLTGGSPEGRPSMKLQSRIPATLFL